MEYAQSRGFFIDAARVATPTDKPRVERVVHYVQHNFFAGEEFVDLPDCRGRRRDLVQHHGGPAHPRHHPVPAPRAFRAEELPLLLPLPGTPFDVPTWSDRKVHRDFHVEVDKAIYSVHHNLVGRTLRARRDSSTVKLYLKGELVKVHPRKPPGSRSTDPADMPTAPRSTPPTTSSGWGAWRPTGPVHWGLCRRHLGHAVALDQDAPGLPPLGSGQEVGSRTGGVACRRALDAEAVDVNLVPRCSSAPGKTPNRTPGLSPS